MNNTIINTKQYYNNNNEVLAWLEGLSFFAVDILLFYSRIYIYIFFLFDKMAARSHRLIFSALIVSGIVSKQLDPPHQLPAYKQLDLREVTSLRPRDNFFPQWDPIGNAESDEKSHK